MTQAVGLISPFDSIDPLDVQQLALFRARQEEYGARLHAIQVHSENMKRLEESLDPSLQDCIAYHRNHLLVLMKKVGSDCFKTALALDSWNNNLLQDYARTKKLPDYMLRGVHVQ